MNASEQRNVWVQNEILRARADIAKNNYSQADRPLEYYRLLIPDFDYMIQGILSNISPIDCLDGGCGTTRAAAELEREYSGQIHATGVTLVKYPPLESAMCLPDERIVLSRIRNVQFGGKKFHLILAVGSIDVSRTIVPDGGRLLELLASDGLFIFAPTTHEPTDKPYRELETSAMKQDIRMTSQINRFGYPIFYFTKGLE